MFIVFEGTDGSGKSTQIHLLAKQLIDSGIKVMITAEPTPYATGGLVRDALGGMTKRTSCELAGLFLCDRIAHCSNPVNGIKAALDSGVAVICDRYYYSSFAYQGLDTDIDWVMRSNLDCPEIIKPDICIYLDVPPEECDKRIQNGRSSREIFEEISTITRIREKYMQVFDLLPDHNIAIINACGTPSDVAQRVYDAVMNQSNDRIEYQY